MILDYRNIKLVMFDLDGTLIDTMHKFADVASNVINKYFGVEKEIAKIEYYRTSGIPFFQQLEELFPGNSLNEKASKEYEERKLESFFSETFPRETESTIKQLRKKNIVVAVSSNNFQHLVDKFIDNNNLVFDYVLGYKKGFAKGKDHFEYIIKNTKIDKENILFIGDSIKDGERAFQNKIKFIAKTGTFSKEDFIKKFPDITIINRLTQLVYILLK